MDVKDNHLFCVDVLCIISYLGMKSWDLHVWDRASTITHVDRVKKSNPWYDFAWMQLFDLHKFVCLLTFSFILLKFQKYLGKNCTYSHFFQSPVTASAYFWSALKAW